jgi:hypothetical protein
MASIMGQSLFLLLSKILFILKLQVDNVGSNDPLQAFPYWWIKWVHGLIFFIYLVIFIFEEFNNSLYVNENCYLKSKNHNLLLFTNCVFWKLHSCIHVSALKFDLSQTMFENQKKIKLVGWPWKYIAHTFLPS